MVESGRSQSGSFLKPPYEYAMYGQYRDPVLQENDCSFIFSLFFDFSSRIVASTGIERRASSFHSFSALFSDSYLPVHPNLPSSLPFPFSNILLGAWRASSRLFLRFCPESGNVCSKCFLRIFSLAFSLSHRFLSLYLLTYRHATEEGKRRSSPCAPSLDRMGKWGGDDGEGKCQADLLSSVRPVANFELSMYIVLARAVRLTEFNEREERPRYGLADSYGKGFVCMM